MFRDDKTKDERKQLNIDYSLPYELLALESALAAYNKELDTEATEIESLAVPCLERLAARVSHFLERLLCLIDWMEAAAQGENTGTTSYCSAVSPLYLVKGLMCAGVTERAREHEKPQEHRQPLVGQSLQTHASELNTYPWYHPQFEAAC